MLNLLACLLFILANFQNLLKNHFFLIIFFNKVISIFCRHRLVVSPPRLALLVDARRGHQVFRPEGDQPLAGIL